MRRSQVVGWGLFLMALLLPLAAHAFTVTVDGTQVTATYTEPTQNDNAEWSALSDLASTRVYYRLQPSGTRTRCAERPASSASGGGSITAPCLVPITTGQEAVVEFDTTATDTSGNESRPSAVQSERIDLLAPLPPE